MDDFTTIALPKGRLLSPTISLLEKIGIGYPEIQMNSRQLIFTDINSKIKFMLIKSFDIPYFVDCGIADIGIVGKDTLLEVGDSFHNMYEFVDLQVGMCKIVLAGKPEIIDNINTKNKIRVASKFPNIAKKYFKEVENKDIDVIYMAGSVEIAPLIGLSDVIVEIVESGKTINENGLVILKNIVDLSARLIVNRINLNVKPHMTNIVSRIAKSLYTKEC